MKETGTKETYGRIIRAPRGEKVEKLDFYVRVIGNLAG